MADRICLINFIGTNATIERNLQIFFSYQPGYKSLLVQPMAGSGLVALYQVQLTYDDQTNLDTQLAQLLLDFTDVIVSNVQYR